jgi:putative membrane protein
MNKLYRLLLVPGAFLCATAVWAQSTTSGAGLSQPRSVSSAQQPEATSAAAPTADTSPETFIKKASQDGMTEVKLASIAQQNTQSEDVRKFAEQMQADHGKANSELQSIATSKHVTVPESLDAEHQAIVRELSGKKGADFDSAYASHMVTAHKKAVALFKSAAHSQDRDISGFAAKTLPTLEHHKGMADDLASKRKLAAAGAPGATS